MKLSQCLPPLKRFVRCGQVSAISGVIEVMYTIVEIAMQTLNIMIVTELAEKLHNLKVGWFN